MNDAQTHCKVALSALFEAITRFEEAAAVVKAQGLKDFDSRALALARTNAEQAHMWAHRAVQS